MFLKKYLSDIYLDLVYDNYENDYINLIDKNNFQKIYDFLKNNNCYFIEDIILNYLELFVIEEKYISAAFLKLKKIYGNNYIEQIGKNMTLIDEIIKLAFNYNEKDSF